MTESKEKYLYGAAVQGIQDYIFQTDKLQDIVGASELVRRICTDLFEKTVGEEAFEEDNLVIAAAGNVKYEFDSREACERVVRHFPKEVMEAAPGVTVSQAVVEYAGAGSYATAVEELEQKLRAQRNRPQKSVTLGHAGLLRSRSTGLPVVGRQDGEYLDEPTAKKRAENETSTRRLCKDAFGQEVGERDFAYYVEDLCGKNNWIAIIHADGNGLGQIVGKIGKEKKAFKAFSHALDKATQAAAQAAFAEVLGKEMWDKAVPIRPIVVGGDDFTVICRGSIAMQFAVAYLRSFEKEAQAKTGHRLTACAGVAFIKSSYPFYYGYGLAEALCSEAKKQAKQKENLADGKTARSCLMFHKVQDSFVTDFKEIARRELTPAPGWSYKYGPYYLCPPREGMMAAAKLLEYPEQLQGKEGNALKSGLRKWMTCLATDGADAAEQLRKRLAQITAKGKVLSELLKDGERTTPVYDVLALCSIMYKETNKK